MLRNTPVSNLSNLPLEYYLENPLKDYEQCFNHVAIRKTKFDDHRASKFTLMIFRTSEQFLRHFDKLVVSSWETFLLRYPQGGGTSIGM